MRVAGVILAGGRSTRMGGRDKAMLPLAGRTLLAHAIDRLAPQVDTLAVNANIPLAPRQAPGLPVLPDTIPGFAGPLAGVLAGLEWAAPGHDALVTVAVDTPFFPLDLVGGFGSANLCKVASSLGHPHPVFTLWPTALLEPLRLFLKEGTTGRVMTFLEQSGFETVDFPLHTSASGPVDPFFNVNTPSDLAEAERIAAEMA